MRYLPKNRDEGEIEVTPEMVDAAVDRLLEFNIENSDPCRAVREIVTLALSAAPNRPNPPS